MLASDASPDPIAAPLLAWYDAHARSLPWRSPPGTAAPDPYRIWLSEVMLQQTTTAHAAPFFVRFVDRWPRVEALAAADAGEVMAAWAGLGYYSRARNLQACAKVVARAGGFPRNEADLRRLPGVGDYTAAAIAAIAFGQRAVVIDANVERVVTRLYAVGEPLPAARKAIRAHAERIAPNERPGDFAQAMMDLGASICTPREPRCLLCPLRGRCEGFASGGPARFPVRAAKRARPQRLGQAFWIEREGMVWLVRRPPRGMLGGMRALPDDGWSARCDGSGLPPADAEWIAAGSVRHAFTHFDLELRLMLSGASDCASQAGGEWWPLTEIAAAGLPTLFARAARLALAREPEGGSSP
jgi:A/G-specific adenine glycosylase